MLSRGTAVIRDLGQNLFDETLVYCHVSRLEE